MDVTFTDRAGRDLGIVVPASGDLAWGADENDFSIDVYGDAVPPEGGMLYVEGSDVGGVVRGYESRSSLGYFSVVGDTWTGVLDSHVVGPDAGAGYLALSGDASGVAQTLIARAGLAGLFRADGPSGVVVSHTFTGSRDAAQGSAGRYMGCWAAIWQMCLANALAVSLSWDAGARRVAVAISPRADLTGGEAESAGVATVGVSRRAPTNHLVCLGQGDLAEREVLHLYADAAGGVSTTQTLFGLDEVAEVYDASSSDAAALRSDGAKRLRELWASSQEVEVAASSGVGLRLGDLVGGTDPRSGVEATAVVTKRVLSFKAGVPSYSYSSTARG